MILEIEKKRMQNHTKVYMNFFGYDESSTILCEMECGAENDSMFNMFCRIKHLESTCMQIYSLIELNKRLKEYENRRNDIQRS